MERNYQKTGVADSQGTGISFVHVNSDGKWQGRYGVMGSNISGYLDGVDILFDEGAVEHKISPRWVFVLNASIASDNGVMDEQAGCKIEKIQIQLPQNRRNLTSKVINALLATSLEWDGWFSAGVWSDNGKIKGYFNTAPGQSKESPAPVKYPFNVDAGKGYVGVPQPRFCGHFGGFDQYDWAQYDNLFLSEAMVLYHRFNGKPYAGEVGFLKYDGVTADAYTKTYKGVPRAGQASAQPNVAPQPAQAATDPKTIFSVYLKSQIDPHLSPLNLGGINLVLTKCTSDSAIAKSGGHTVAGILAAVLQMVQSVDPEGLYSVSGNQIILAANSGVPMPDPNDLPF